MSEPSNPNWIRPVKPTLSRELGQLDRSLVCLGTRLSDLNREAMTIKEILGSQPDTAQARAAAQLVTSAIRGVDLATLGSIPQHVILDASYYDYEVARDRRNMLTRLGHYVFGARDTPGFSAP